MHLKLTQCYMLMYFIKNNKEYHVAGWLLMRKFMP